MFAKKYSFIYCHKLHNCSILEGESISDDTSNKCDDLIVRLDYLDNISPDFYLFDDDEFPRITNDSSKGWTSKY